MKNVGENISAAATTVLTTGSGILHLVTVNTAANGAITIYDSESASGEKIATLKASVAEGTYFYEVPFNVGLTIVTAAATDITVTYSS